MLSRARDRLAKAWRQLLALAAFPAAAPRRLWQIAVHHVHAGELLHLAPFADWLRGEGIRTVLDAGAHTGEFASAIKALLPEARLYCFEPLADCHRRLADRLRRHGGCTAFRVALADRSGTATLHRSRFSKASSLLPMTALHERAFPWSEGSSPVEVELRPLDAMRDQLDLRRRVLLKIDVQGAELAVLRGAAETLAEVDYVLVEISLEPLYEGEAGFGEIDSFLAARGFRYAGGLDQLLSPLDGRILQQDALFVRA